MKLEYCSAAEIGRLVSQRRVSAVEVLEYFKNRIQQRNSSINAFVYTRFEEAYTRAEAIDKSVQEYSYTGPFAGVPFALKDFLPSKKGWTNTHGGVQCMTSIDDADSVFCAAMETAGGVAIGKTNAPAFGFRGVTDNKMYGPTSTPFNILYNSGGSSGGSAAAVADGLVPIAEGGDAGGSIRIPAAWCNLFGFKAGAGVIPSVCRPDAWAATHPFCCAGGLTKSVEDAAILLQYMAGFNSRDPFSKPKSVDYYRDTFRNPDPFDGLRGKRIAFTMDFGIFEVEDSIKSNLRSVVQLLQDAGIVVEEVSPKLKYNAVEIADSWCTALMFDSVIELEQAREKGLDYLKEHPEQFPEELVYWKDKCAKSSVWDLYKFNIIRTSILDTFEDIFEKYDFILSPIACCEPVLNNNDRNTKGPKTINGKPMEGLIGWSETHLVNMIGNPAASLPAGLLSNNLPVGVHLIARKGADLDLLKASRAYEYLNPWRDNFEIPFNRQV